MPKPLNLQNLLQDLVYAVQGTCFHDWLFALCPPRPGLRVLEPGCGSAKFSLAYGIRGVEGTAFDLDEQVLAYSRRLKSSIEALLGKSLPNMGIQRGDIFEATLPEGGFDLVFNEGVAQHWTDEPRRQGCIDRMARWSRDLVVIMGNNGLNPAEQLVDRTMAFTYEGMPPTRKCFTPDELRERMRQAGLADIHVDPLGGDWEHATLLGAWGRKAA